MSKLTRPSRSDRLSFWITNRIPRHALTAFLGWFSRIENRWLARITITVWQWFVDDLRLFEARKQRFNSLHDCFTRELAPGVRPLAESPDVLVSPCDTELGAMGRIERGRLYQAKGLDYTLAELVEDAALAQGFEGGHFLTLRLKSSMYHRFHAPDACQPAFAHYIAGEVWNVNPPTLRCLDRVFCKNERVVVPLNLTNGPGQVTLVAVAAVLVASVRLTGITPTLDSHYRGVQRLPWHRSFQRGDEMGYFQHGSTIIVLADHHFAPVETLREGDILRMGQALLRRQEPRTLLCQNTVIDRQ